MRSLMLGNGFEINFNPNMSYTKIVELIVNEKSDFLLFLNSFLNKHENFFFYFYLFLLKISDEEIYNFILKNIIFFDNMKSIEDNLNVIFNDAENFFKRISKENVNKEEFSKRISELEKIWERKNKGMSLPLSLPLKIHYQSSNSKLFSKYDLQISILDTWYLFFINKYNWKNKEPQKENSIIGKFTQEAYDSQMEDTDIDFVGIVNHFFESKFFEGLIKEFFCFYIRNEFYKTRLVMELFLKRIPESKIFLRSYDQIITTNYNDYSFLNNNVVNIHGKINDQSQQIIWFEKGKEKENWKKLIKKEEII